MRNSDLLSPEQGHTLVSLARRALETRIGGKKETSIQVDPRLREEGATFVTLSIGDSLRGCIGTPEAHTALVDDVQQNAIRAATTDPRFPPVSPDELEKISIEVSVLTPPSLLRGEPLERPHRVRPGVDGLILVSGFNRGLLLPQVWEKIPDPEDFLEILCRKAGLSPAAWRRSNSDLYTFQVQAFHE